MFATGGLSFPSRIPDSELKFRACPPSGSRRLGRVSTANPRVSNQIFFVSAPKNTRRGKEPSGGHSLTLPGPALSPAGDAF